MGELRAGAVRQGGQDAREAVVVAVRSRRVHKVIEERAKLLALNDATLAENWFRANRKHSPTTSATSSRPPRETAHGVERAQRPIHRELRKARDEAKGAKAASESASTAARVATAAP